MRFTYCTLTPDCRRGTQRVDRMTCALEASQPALVLSCSGMLSYRTKKEAETGAVPGPSRIVGLCQGGSCHCGYWVPELFSGETRPGPPHGSSLRYCVGFPSLLNKRPPNEWLRTTQIDYLRVLDKHGYFPFYLGLLQFLSIVFCSFQSSAYIFCSCYNFHT